MLLTLLRARRGLVVRAASLAVVVSVMEAATTALAMPLLLALGNDQSSAAPGDSKLQQHLSGLLGLFPPRRQLLALACTILVTTAVKNACLYLSQVNINKLQLQVGADVRRRCVGRLLSLGLQFHSQSKLGELLSYTGEHSERVARLTSYVLESTLDVLVICLLLVVLVSISPLLTLLTLASLALVFLGVQRTVRSVQVYSKRATEMIDETSSLIAEVVGGIRVVKSFDAEARERSRVEAALQARYDAELGAYKHLSAVTPLTETCGLAVLLLLMVIGSSFTGGAQPAALPLLLTFILALMRVLPRVTHLNSMRSQFSLLSGSLRVVEKFLGRTPAGQAGGGGRRLRGIRRELSFENVSFTFSPDGEPTLRNVSFTMKKGTVTALVGPSGGGKSTIADLAMRFHDPDSGRITIDGTDIREFDSGSLRRAFAMVSQDTFLFNASLRDNIAYGCPQATERQVVEAALKAHAYEFIEKLPRGLETVVGNRGLKLSGGQRQRIAIARAILRNPSILILDEATSALDTTSERIVQRAIEDVSRGRTVLVIAHRLSTVEKADKIVFVKGGAVLGEGTHRELSLRLAEYAELYRPSGARAGRVAEAGVGL
jgi:ABC-type multidrug transport system fused ATPase/permease subunit